MAYPESHQVPYTKYPNRYNDIIKPRLTGTQRDICDVVIRMTWGWHEESAEISNTVFAKKANRSKQGIIKGKKQLEEMGLLIVLGKGGGSKTNEYMLDLWYDNPDKSVRASMLRQEEELLEIENQFPQEEQKNILELFETPAIDEPTTFEEPEVKMESLLSQEKQEDIPELVEIPTIGEPQQEMEEFPNVDIPESQAVELENHTPEKENSEQEVSDMESAENPVKIDVSDSPTSKLSLPPYISKEDLSINIREKERKQTVSSEEEKAERKEATATVCSLFRSWGAELEPNDYAFVGWSLKTYGIDIVQQKLDIMRFQRSRNIEFTNPMGWLRSALSRNYRYSSWDSDVTKAKEKAKKAKERLRLEQIEREREIQEAERSRKEAETKKSRLTPEDREGLRKAAIEQISDMGIAENWINEPLVKSVENEILRERMVNSAKFTLGILI